MSPTRPGFDSKAYWIDRHKKYSASHEATGLLGSTARANAAIYEARKNALRAALGCRDLTGLQVLDAGCGRGDFSVIYRDLGARVYGCDVSPLAVEQCREQVDGVFACGTICDVPSLFKGARFDLIHCFDVLYHIVDEQEWCETLRTLSAVSSSSGIWLVTEFAKKQLESDHVRIRGRLHYEQELRKHSFRIVAERRMHWLFGASEEVLLRLPGLARWTEPLSGLWPLNRLARSVLWTIGRGPQQSAARHPALRHR